MIRPYGGLRVAVLLLPWVCTHGYIPSPLRGYDTPGRMMIRPYGGYDTLGRMMIRPYGGYDTPGRMMIRPYGGLRVAVLPLPWVCTHGYIPSPLRGSDLCIFS